MDLPDILGALIRDLDGELPEEEDVVLQGQVATLHRIKQHASPLLHMAVRPEASRAEHRLRRADLLARVKKDRRDSALQRLESLPLQPAAV